MGLFVNRLIDRLGLCSTEGIFAFQKEMVELLLEVILCLRMIRAHENTVRENSPKHRETSSTVD